ncbi:MAG: hypothetical protein II795_06315, partial [Firmicutes bacterium]|nr:hypothetical protein [Bacillota bacterium]
PAAVVEGERAKQTRYIEQLRQVEEQLGRLS